MNFDYDDAMDSWGVGDAEADDIGAYVAARNEKRRVRDHRKAFAPAAKLYGYQEPVSIAKPRPRVVTGLDNGGWDFTTQNSGIPKYNWLDDPLRKKLVPRLVQTSPRDKHSSAAAPSGRSMSHPLRSGHVPLRPVGPSSRVPPIASNLFDAAAHPGPSSNRPSEAAPTQVPNLDELPANRPLESSSAPSGRPSPRGADPFPPGGRRAPLPAITKPTLKAYSAPSVRRPPTQLPPLVMKQQRTQSNTARGRDASPAAQRRLPSISPQRRGVNRGTRSGAAAAAPPVYDPPRGHDGGELPTTGRRTLPPDGDPTLSSDVAQPPPPPPRDPCAELEAAIEGLRAQLAAEKAQRIDLTTKRGDLTHDLADYQANIQSAKADLKRAEKTQKALVAAEKDRTTLTATCRKIEVQLRDFSRMLSTASARLDEHRVQGASNARGNLSPRAAGEVEAAGDRMLLRDSAKSKDGLRARIAQLKEEQAFVLDELARVQAAQNDRIQRDVLIRDRIARERKAAVEELKARLQAEIDREVFRMRENHAKAHRHRERELEAHAAQEAAENDQGLKKLDATVSGGGNLHRLVGDARIQLATQNAIADELAAQAAGKQQQLDRTLEAVKTKKVKVSDLTNAIAAAERQREIAGASDASSSSASQQPFEQERKTLRQHVETLRAEEAALVDALQASEADLKAAQSREQTGRDAAASRLAVLKSELAAAQAELTDAEAGRKVAKMKLKSAKDEAAAIDAKDSVIETLTKRVAQARKASTDASRRNTELLESLDQSERLLSVSGAS